MIITPVQKVKSCKKCPNLRHKSKTATSVNYVCLAIMKVIGSDDFQFQNGVVYVDEDVVATNFNGSWNGSVGLLYNGTTNDALLNNIDARGNITLQVGKSYDWANGASITVEADGDIIFN